MSASANPAIPADGAPDWPALEREILCPLCGYNLRGLVEPRCPECGHQSTWPELLAELEREPWFFEHQRKWGFIAFIKTLLLSQFPRRFWRRVKPTDEPRIGRLAKYFISVAMLVGIILAAQPLTNVVRTYRGIHQRRMDLVRRLSTQQTNPRVQAAITNAGGIQPLVAEISPYPPLTEVLLNPDWTAWDEPDIRLPLFIAILSWPFLTALSLQVFRQTLSRARIKLAHIVRCVVYTADACLLLVVASLIIEPFTADSALTRDQLARGIFLEPLLVMLLGAMLLALNYRLWIAIRKYLRIPQPGATCIASQVMVGMVLLLLCVWLF
jgi:hypothetical protein